MDDIQLAKKYVRKAMQSKGRGIEFTLTFQQYKALLRRKRCQITGVKLKSGRKSIDRLDNRLGYVPGNCVACDAGVNMYKGRIENAIDTVPEAANPEALLPILEAIMKVPIMKLEELNTLWDRLNHIYEEVMFAEHEAFEVAGR